MKSKNIKQIFKTLKKNYCNYNQLSEIVLYGAGQMGVDASNCLLESKANIKFFADKNSDIIGKKINNILVKHPEDFTQKEKENYFFVISVVTVSYNIIYDYLKSLGCKNICFVGDLVNEVCKNPYISKTWRLVDPRVEEIKKLEYIFKKLTDEDSKKSLIHYLDWSCNNFEREKFAPIRKMNDKYFIPEVIDVLGDEEIFVIYDFLSSNPVEEIEKNVGRYNKIYIIEPTTKKYKQLENQFNSDKISISQFGLANENTEKYFSYGEGLSVKSRFVDFKTDKAFTVKKLDDVMTDKPYSYLKIYGLGLGLEAIKGSINTIKKFRPVVAVTIHHTREDFIEIPYFLVDNLDNYNFYLRLHSYCGFETLFYAIPKEKVKNASRIR